jgi:hypothetical protein
MNGYSSHTYMWINQSNERFWVKYHFKSDQGIECLTQDEADRLAGEDGDYHQRDLYFAIERGEFPSWTLRMQIMPFEEPRPTGSIHSTSPRCGRTRTTRSSTSGSWIQRDEIRQRAFEYWRNIGGEMVRAAYTLHAEDDDYGQARQAHRRKDRGGHCREGQRG